MGNVDDEYDTSFEYDSDLTALYNFINNFENERQGNVINTWRLKIQSFSKKLPDELRKENLIHLGKAALSLIIQTEWTGPDLDVETEENIGKLRCDFNFEEISCLLLTDSDDLSPIKYPHLLLFSLTVFKYILEFFPNSKDVEWWLLRTLFIQQLFLDEKSPKLFNNMESIMDLLRSSLSNKNNIINLLLESARIRLFYGYVEKAGQDIEDAALHAGLKYNFTGALGRRTHYQVHDLAQLVMQVEVKSNCTTVLADERRCAPPKKVPLVDDVRMEHVKLSDPNVVSDVELTSQHVAILLAALMTRRKAFAEDELSLEENRTMVERMVSHHGAWSVELSTLLLRSHLERTSRRTAERAMLQVQAVLDEMQEQSRPVQERLKDIFISHLPTRRGVELSLAEHLLSLGAIKSALDICLRLQQWELAIVCYNALQLRNKAKELIEQELAKGETPKLWCLLGDATDDVMCYEKAWLLSEKRSARAQRHWANYFYIRKQYGNSITHLEMSLEINSLQSDLWFRLGFAALHEEQWELSAKAYRRYCALEHDSFEAWNNLARCYCELNQQERAWRALKEALKLDTTNWRVWDNYMRVSAHLKHYQEVIRSYNQLLDIKKTSHVDMDVVMSLLRGYFTCEEKQVQTTFRTSLMDLLQRLASSPSQHEVALWVLCADLCGGQKEWELLIKAHTCAVKRGAWYTDIEACQQVVSILERLLPNAEQHKELRSVYLLIARPSIGAITRNHPDSNLCAQLQEAIDKLVPSTDT